MNDKTVYFLYLSILLFNKVYTIFIPVLGIGNYLERPHGQLSGSLLCGTVVITTNH